MALADCGGVDIKSRITPARNESPARGAALEIETQVAYSNQMDQWLPSPTPNLQPELGPAGTPPHVAVAPGLREQPHGVVRAQDDTDEDHEARSRLLAAALAHPENP